jgi:hypothetical protein
MRNNTATSDLSDQICHTPAAMSAAAAVPQVAKAANLWTEWFETHVCVFVTHLPAEYPKKAKCSLRVHTLP